MPRFRIEGWRTIYEYINTVVDAEDEDVALDKVLDDTSLWSRKTADTDWHVVEEKS